MHNTYYKETAHFIFLEGAFVHCHQVGVAVHFRLEVASAHFPQVEVVAHCLQVEDVVHCLHHHLHFQVGHLHPRKMSRPGSR